MSSSTHLCTTRGGPNCSCGNSRSRRLTRKLEESFRSVGPRQRQKGTTPRSQKAPTTVGEGQRQERRWPGRDGVKAGERQGDVSGIQAGPLPPKLSVCSLLNSLPQHLLHLDSALGRFATSSSIDPWPMPPPYPEACREAGDDFRVRSRERAANSMVVALSFLHLREARQAPTSMALGKRLSSRQWSVVRRLERMLDAWIIHHLVTSESMGRNAAKIEALDGMLGQLETVLIDSFPC